MKLIAPLILILALSGALYQTREVWPEDDYKAFADDKTPGQSFGAYPSGAGRQLRADPSRDALQARSRVEGWMGAESQRGVQRAGGFQYGQGGAGRSGDNPMTV